MLSGRFYASSTVLIDNGLMSVTSPQIKKIAAAAGFEKCGIVRAEPLDTEADRLADWLAKGFHGAMAWMAREPEKRTDPRLLFTNAESIIVVAQNYFTCNEHSIAGKVSRYAWGDDYHDVMRERLSLMLDAIQRLDPDVTGKICVDTTPFMDKSWAVRGGLGWLGKHSNLITTDLGSWVFIGSLLIDRSLEYDHAIVEDHCGTCTACIDACPTAAIVEPYVVDSRKCISYATIELRDEKLSDEMAANLNGWIYGCDICQDVCPWNRFEQPSGDPRFEPRCGETSIDPNKVVEMTHEEYAERFRGSAMKRAKLSGMRRNARYLLGSHDMETENEKIDPK